MIRLFFPYSKVGILKLIRDYTMGTFLITFL